MSYRILPEYKGNIVKAFLPKTGQLLIDEGLDNLAESLSRNTDARIINTELTRMGDMHSLWVRDPAIFVGYNENEKPSVLMSKDVIAYAVGSMKDQGDKLVLQDYLKQNDVSIIDSPFFVIGGDCLITDKHAVLGWATPQVSGWAYGDYDAGIDAIKRGFETVGIETVILDDIGKLDEEKYHSRRNTGYFHLDTVASFLSDKNGCTHAVISDPKLSSPDSGERQVYSDYVSETLNKLGYAVSLSPDVMNGHYLWTPTNILMNEDNRKVMLSTSPSLHLNEEAEKTYAELGYETELVDAGIFLSAQRGGVRCACLAVKE